MRKAIFLAAAVIAVAAQSSAPAAAATFVQGALTWTVDAEPPPSEGMIALDYGRFSNSAAWATTWSQTVEGVTIGGSGGSGEGSLLRNSSSSNSATPSGSEAPGGFLDVGKGSNAGYYRFGTLQTGFSMLLDKWSSNSGVTVNAYRGDVLLGTLDAASLAAAATRVRLGSVWHYSEYVSLSALEGGFDTISITNASTSGVLFASGVRYSDPTGSAATGASPAPLPALAGTLPGLLGMLGFLGMRRRGGKAASA